MAIQSAVIEASSLPTLASVIFIRITEFARRPVAEQARLRAQLEAALAISLIGVAPRNRIVLDAPDGIVVAVLRDPAAALAIAQRCLNVTGAGVSVAIAINHGAIRALPDESGDHGLIGDAIGTASAIAHFAGPARLFVSRTFRDALAEAAPGLVVQLQPAGVFTDANVRTHELLAPDDKALPNRRRLFVAIAVTVLCAIGAAAVYFRADLRQALYADRPASITFDVYPDGDVYVDGISRGRTPPLRELSLDAGTHSIEVRKRGYASHTVDIAVEAGESAAIKHSFEPGQQRGLLRRLRELIAR